MCPQQVPGVEVTFGFTARPGPDGQPGEPTGTFRVGETVGVYFEVTRLESPLVMVVVRVESQDRVFPVGQPQPLDRPGRHAVSVNTQGGSPGLHAFALASPQSQAVAFVVPFLLQ